MHRLLAALTTALLAVTILTAPPAAASTHRETRCASSSYDAFGPHVLDGMRLCASVDYRVRPSGAVTLLRSRTWLTKCRSARFALNDRTMYGVRRALFHGTTRIKGIRTPRQAWSCSRTYERNVALGYLSDSIAVTVRGNGDVKNRGDYHPAAVVLVLR